MTSAQLVRRRLELGIGIRELGSRANILYGALKDAERRDTVEHFTVAQIRRLGEVLQVDPHELLSESPDETSVNEITDIHAELSDEALVLLAAIYDEERETGYRSELANGEHPSPATTELIHAHVLTIVDGFAVIDPRITESLAPLGSFTAVANGSSPVRR